MNKAEVSVKKLAYTFCILQGVKIMTLSTHQMVGLATLIIIGILAMLAYSSVWAEPRELPEDEDEDAADRARAGHLDAIIANIDAERREERRRLEAFRRIVDANERRQHQREQAALAKPIEWPALDAYLDRAKLEVRHEPGVTEFTAVIAGDGQGYGISTTYDANGKMLHKKIHRTGVSVKAE